jgi:uncharacterized tellurite resistance protein B-like protein
MLHQLKRQFLKGSGSEQSESSHGTDFKYEKEQIATCAVLIEMANSDGDYAAVEKDLIFNLIKGEYGISDEEVNDLMEVSQHRIDEGESFSIEFIDIINRDFSSEEKFAVLNNLLKLLLIDKNTDSFELYYLKNIATGFGISDQSFKAIEAEVKKKLAML